MIGGFFSHAITSSACLSGGTTGQNRRDNRTEDVFDASVPDPVSPVRLKPDTTTNP